MGLSTSVSARYVSDLQDDHRYNVYYWKCDRPSLLHPEPACRKSDCDIPHELLKIISKELGFYVTKLESGGGQGNHLTFTFRHAEQDYFIRVEDGPEGDSFMEIETALISMVKDRGVPVPRVFAADASRKIVPFAWQILEKIEGTDLASLAKSVELNERRLAYEIGRNLAKWQGVELDGYGPLSSQVWRSEGRLIGLHNSYRSYFFNQLPRHLGILMENDLLSSQELNKINELFRSHEGILELKSPCLVHKDLALWNILGDKDRINAFIDWEDAIGGDPMDDFSLLGCFHSGHFILDALSGYREILELPNDFHQRFWLHLLRNIVMKAVIRVISGLFEKSDDFFLIPKGSSGKELKEFTRQRILIALEGLASQSKISNLP